MGDIPLKAGRSGSILNRALLAQNLPLTETQALTDQLVSVSIQEGTNLKTAAAMLGAGWVGRATRIGALAALPGQAFARGASYVPALAAESAAFAGIERGFHPSTQPFQKDWARAAVTLAGLKAFGGMSRRQNIVLQHLFTDLGLVGGHQAAAVVGLMDKPQGSFAQQMLQAEASNWHMKGSLAFAHSFSPRLSAMERSLDIFLNAPPSHRPFEQRQSSFSSRFAFATEGAPESLFAEPVKAHETKGPDILEMSGNENNGGSGKNGLPSKVGASPGESGSGHPLSFETLAALARADRSAVNALRSLILLQNDSRAVQALVEAAQTNPVSAIWGLQDLNPKGNDAERAACEALKIIDVAPLVETIKTNPESLYLLMNLKRKHGNMAARQAIETFDIAEMIQKAETDNSFRTALEFFGMEGNEAARVHMGLPYPFAESPADLLKKNYPPNTILDTFRDYRNSWTTHEMVPKILDKADFSVPELHTAYRYMENRLSHYVSRGYFRDSLDFLQAMNHIARLLALKGESGSEIASTPLGRLKASMVAAHSQGSKEKLESALEIFKAHALQANPSQFGKTARSRDIAAPAVRSPSGFITSFDYFQLIRVAENELEIIEGKKTPPSEPGDPGPSQRGPADSSDRSEQPDSIKRRFLLITSRLLLDGRPALIVLEEILTRDQDPTTRMTAAETLGNWQDPAARPALERALSDSSQEVRDAARWALRKLGLSREPGGGSSPQPFNKGLISSAPSPANDPLAPEIRKGPPPSRPEAEAKLSNPDPELRMSALYDLTLLVDPASIPALEKALQNEKDPRIQPMIRALLFLHSLYRKNN